MSVMPMNALPTIAVLIDAENAQYSTIKQVLDELAVFGNVTVRRAYGDFTNSRLQNWKHEMNRCAIKPIHGFAYAKDKNATDILMVIDAMDLLHTQPIDIFCIVAGDSDYIGLVQRIREAGKRTIGIAKDSRSRSFQESCDKFIATDDLNRIHIQSDSTSSTLEVMMETSKPATEQKEERRTRGRDSNKQSSTNNAKREADLLAVFDKTFDAFGKERNGRILLSQLTEEIKRLNKRFSVKDYGYDTLSKAFKDSFFETHYTLITHDDRCTFSVERL
jgi:uncharacterized protein (TIGR00288 family)